MLKVLILKGLPGSGKSTYAKTLLDNDKNKYKRINKDDLRAMLDNAQHSKANEQFVERSRDMIMLAALEEGKHVIIDDTNLAERHILHIQNLVQKFRKDTNRQVDIEIKEIDTPVEECIERDKKRDKKVGRKVIMSMYRHFKLDNKRGPHYQAQNPKLPAAIICDLDGTLSIMHDRSPFDFKACERDLLNEPIAKIIKNYKKLGIHIILLSGREAIAKEETKRWLAKYDIPYDNLYMRAEGDQRKDAIIKKELFDAHVKDKYHIEFVLDDRDQVVDLWRLELGLPCLQVNYGDF
ncbi:MAG: AAA family ATPase [Bernardetiaceae bacterium]|nr:AAA family ATPase [Bernardetiaceae bacterium]